MGRKDRLNSKEIADRQIHRMESTCDLTTILPGHVILFTFNLSQFFLKIRTFVFHI